MGRSFDITPHSEFVRITPSTFDVSTTDRLLNVPSQHILVALGCGNCANRLCIDIDTAGDQGAVLAETEQGANRLGIPANILSKHSRKTIVADCPDAGACEDYLELGLEVSSEDARLRAKPERVTIYQPRGTSSTDTWWF